MDFETLKSSSSNFDKLTKALETNLNPEDQSNKNKYQDDRFWKPELDKTGNGYVLLDFYLLCQAKTCLAKSMVSRFPRTRWLVY